MNYSSLFSLKSLWLIISRILTRPSRWFLAISISLIPYPSLITTPWLCIFISLLLLGTLVVPTPPVVEIAHTTVVVFLLSEFAHTVETCFMKHGYPPSYSYKISKSSINNTTDFTPFEDSFTPYHRFPISIAALQDQYNKILQLIHQ